MGSAAILILVAALATVQSLDVSSEAEFLVGLGSPSISKLRITSDIGFGGQSWVPKGVHSENAKVYVLTRNLTITAAPDGPYPTLDFSLVSDAKLKVPDGVVLTLQHVILRAASVGVTYKFVDPNSAGLLQNFDVVQVMDACPPTNSTLLFIRGCPRPSEVPGSQSALLAPAPVCVAALAAGAGRQCWQTAVAIVDFAFSSGQALYDVHSVNYSLVCEQVVTEECIAAMGLDNCTLLLAGTGSDTLPPPAPPPPPCESVAIVAGGMSPGLIGGIVGATVGGTLLLAVLLVLLVLWRRRRDNHRQQLKPDVEASAQPGSGSVAAMRSLDSSATTTGRQDEMLKSVSLTLAPELAEVVWKVSNKQANKAVVVAAAAVADGDGQALDDSAAPTVLAAPDQGQDSTSCSSPTAAWGGSCDLNHLDLVKELSDRSHRPAPKPSAADTQLAFHDVIGSGAYGTVYRGSWKGLPVAIKSIMFTSDSPAGGLAKNHAVLMEAALSQSISHPNVVITFNCDLRAMSVDKDSALGSSPSGLQVNAQASTLQHWRLFIIQELCCGGSLRDAIESHLLASHVGKIPEISLDVLLPLACGLVSGMGYLHSRNVIHGDLNPSNVLLQREGDRVIPKVCDFGLSIHLSSSRSHMSNARRGTPFYMAPELAQHGSLSKASDVYALGVMLWELYMGMVVWTVSSYGQLVMHSTFPRMPRGTPAQYSELVAACVSAAPADRPTVAAILAQLQAMAQDNSAAHQVQHTAAGTPLVSPRSSAAPGAGAGAQVAEARHEWGTTPPPCGTTMLRYSAMDASQPSHELRAPPEIVLDNLQSA